MVARYTWPILLVVITGCLDPYSPRVNPLDINLLVVDGSLDVSDGSAVVALGRAVSVDAPESFPNVLGAFVSIEDTHGNVYQLHEGDSGNYRATGIPVQHGDEFRLHIVTTDDDVYDSDFVKPLSTPPIDSLTWTTDDEKLTIQVSTHDPTNESRYFRWTYDETWNYHAALLSQYVVENRQLRGRRPDEMMYYCWNTAPSYNIVAGSTARLSSAVVSKFPVQFIPAGSIKLQMKYSILLKQMAISEDEFKYLEQLKKTTESIGGLFDPQPTSVIGNVHRVRKDSPLAVGYFSVGNTTKMRMYINGADVPKIFREIWPLPGCLPPDSVCAVPSPTCAITVNDLIDAQIVGIYAAGKYTLTNSRCADCRFQGGVTMQPDWWE